MNLPNFTKWLAYVKANQISISLSKMALQKFPKHEKYCLTDQIRRSSRSVGANLAESAGKSGYPKHFAAKLADAISENYETQHWVICAHAEGYIEEKSLVAYINATNEIGRLINYMKKNPSKFIKLKPPNSQPGMH